MPQRPRILISRILQAALFAATLMISPGLTADGLAQRKSTDSNDLPDELVEPSQETRKRKAAASDKKKVSRAEAREKKAAAAKNGRKKKGKKMPVPKEIDKWHTNVTTFYVIKEDEFHKSGYVRLNGEWVPVFVFRRFKMMSKQYEHFLVVKGRPSKIPKVKGMALIPFGFEVRNEGFEYALPTFASVDRGQKKNDENEFLNLAEAKLKEFGFEVVKWIDDTSKKTENIVNTWSTN
jgi:hypothetical protein